MAFSVKTDNKIMQLLGVNVIRHYVADTNKGQLTFQLRKGETEYEFVLDAVPVEKELQKELMDIIFPSKIVIPQVDKAPTTIAQAIEIKPINKGGRPKGYKKITKK